MDANLLNQFILATAHIFKQVGNIDIRKEAVRTVDPNYRIISDIATIIGITGAVRGQMVIVINEAMALKFASALLMGEVIKEFNELAESSICEMGNMIAAAASQRMHDMGHVCDVSCPSIIRGKSVEISLYPRAPVFVVQFGTDWGPLQIILKLEMDKS